MSIEGLLNVWKVRRWFVLAFFVTGGIWGAVGANAVPISYEAKADLLLSATNYEAQYGQLGPLNAFEFEQVMTTKTELITKPKTQASAAELLGGTAEDGLPAEYEVEREQGTQIVRLVANAAEPDDAVDTVTAVASVFAEQENEAALAAAEFRLAEIEARVASTEQTLSDVAEEINRLTRSLALGTDTTSVALENLIGERNAVSAKLADERLELDRARIDVADAASAATIVNLPEEAEESRPIPVPVGAVLGALMLGALGVAIAAVREELFDRVRDAQDIEAGLMFRPYAVVPHKGVLRKSNAPARQAAVARLSNHINAVVDEGSSVVTVVPPRPSDTIAIVSSLEVLATRTLLVEFDLDPASLVFASSDLRAQTNRRADDAEPTADHDDTRSTSGAAPSSKARKRRGSVATAPEKELVEELEAAPLLPERVLDHSTGSLLVPLSELLDGGGSSPLGIEHLPAIVDELRGRFDRIVFEGPSVLESAGVLSFVDLADSVVVMATARKTAMADLIESVALIESARDCPIGVVLLGQS